MAARDPISRRQAIGMVAAGAGAATAAVVVPGGPGGAQEAGGPTGDPQVDGVLAVPARVEAAGGAAVVAEALDPADVDALVEAGVEPGPVAEAPPAAPEAPPPTTGPPDPEPGAGPEATTPGEDPAAEVPGVDPGPVAEAPPPPATDPEAPPAPVVEEAVPVPVVWFPVGVTPRAGDHVTVTDGAVEGVAAVPLCSWVDGVPVAGAGGGYVIGDRTTAPVGGIERDLQVALSVAARDGIALSVCLLDTDGAEAQVLAVRPVRATAPVAAGVGPR